MKVYLEPPGNMSQAMFRVARALARHAPPDKVVVTTDLRSADMQVLHVIGADAYDYAVPTQKYSVIQYCFKTAGGDLKKWQPFWNDAMAVWSYYPDLPVMSQTKFYLAPLGVDGKFTAPATLELRLGLMTSGYVNGFPAEAIQDAAMAADRNNMPIFHLGPEQVHGMTMYPAKWFSILGVTDEVLAQFYRKCGWVSGLRHVEGFELPAVEGLVAGCRPVLFDRVESRYWFNGHAVFVPECHGQPLVEVLSKVFSQSPEPITDDEKAKVQRKFNWRTIAEGFWATVLRGETL